MAEFITKVVVLEKETIKEYESLIYLFSEDKGLILAKARGIKKITSKLAGHLETKFLTLVRLVEGRETWVVDALQEGEIKRSFKELNIIRFLAGRWQRDDEIWDILINNKKISEKDWLAYFGFNSEFASCDICGRGVPVSFDLREHIFLCPGCQVALKLSNDELVLI